MKHGDRVCIKHDKLSVNGIEGILMGNWPDGSDRRIVRVTKGWELNCKLLLPASYLELARKSCMFGDGGV